MIYVENIFWSNGSYVNGGKLFLLYSDGTYDVIRTKHHACDMNTNGIKFKSFMNLKILRQKKYSKEEAINYIANKDKEFEEI